MRLSTPQDIDVPAPSEVRKRRIELRQKSGTDDSSKRVRYEDSTCSSSGEDDESSSGNTTSYLRGYKKHARYVPEVPMTKAELSAWRKEARRVRNRESAAASRQKTRSRIEELEGEVDTLQEKYKQALQRIADLENNVSGSFTSEALCQDMIRFVHTPATATTRLSFHKEASVTVSPPRLRVRNPCFFRGPRSHAAAHGYVLTIN